MSQSSPRRAGRAVWHGTLREQLDLIAAVEHHCQCGHRGPERSHDPCSAHAMLANDQRALDGLLWNRRLANRLLAEEGISAPGACL